MTLGNMFYGLSAVRARCALFGFLLIVVQAPAQSDDGGLTIVGSPVPGVFEADSPGPYADFFDDVIRRSGVPLNLVMMPTKRFTRALFDRTADCSYMGTNRMSYYHENGHDLEDFILTRPFNRIRMRAYTPARGPLIESEQDLAGKLIAADEGIAFSSIVATAVPFASSLLATPSVGEAFQLLGAGRVDVVFAYATDADLFFKISGQSGYQASQKYSLLEDNEVLVCWPSSAARKLIGHIDHAVSVLRASGDLKRRYGFEVR